MKTTKSLLFSAIFVALMLLSFVASEGEEAKAIEKEEDVKVDEEKLTYAKGSLCGYCDYCKVNLVLSLIKYCEILWYFEQISARWFDVL